MGDSLGPEAVVPRLRGRLGRPYEFVATCPSTQRLLEGKPEGAVVCADEQTEGRGRLGRRWEAPPGKALLFSVALEPEVAGDRLPELSVVVGEAVAEAIERVTGLPTAVKLPNDVLVGGRKAAGILAEARDGRVVLGIGINANQEEGELPPGVGATSLLVERGAPVDRAELLAALLETIERRYDAWLTATG